MYRIFRHYIPKTLIILGLAEALILLVSIYLGATLTLALTRLEGFTAASEPHLVPTLLPLQASAFCAAMLLGMAAMGFYQRGLRDGPAGTILRLFMSFAIGFVVMAFIFLTLPKLVIDSAVFGLALLSAFVGIATCRLICFAHTDARMAQRVLVLGVGERAKQIENLRRASDQAGIRVVGFVDIGIEDVAVDASRVIKPSGRLRELAERLAVDEIVVAVDDRRKGIPLEQTLECKMHGIRVLEAPTFYERQLGKIRLDALHPSNVIFADGFTQAIIKRTEKRILDVSLALVLLLVSLPVLVITAIAVALESGFPILYRQERVGIRGQTFTVYKFRSMRQDAEGDGVAVWARSEDDRITGVGHFIRKTRIDELPQLFNVLKGDMSFVGPRPERPEFVAELKQAIPYYDLRHHVKPGITGWAQVSYPYGASINDSREKLQYDLYYLKNYSIFLDINVLLLTVQVILFGKGR